MIFDGDPLDVDDLMNDSVGTMDVEVSPRSAVPLDGTLVDWRTLSDADAQAAWNSLREWVEWFSVRYRIPVTVVPTCWYRHGRLLEELSALHAAHTAAFDPFDSGLGPIGWHERLDLALPRLRHAYYGGCSRGHQSYSLRSWATTTEEQAWNAWVRDARSPSPGPSSHAARGSPLVRRPLLDPAADDITLHNRQFAWVMASR